VKYRFVNRPAVQADIINAVSFYGQVSPKLAKQFLFRIREAKVHIKRSPFGFEIKYKNVRTLHLKQFPFHIHYIVDEGQKLIVIIAIIHAYRNPTDYSAR
jgi:ParE toxin of type II toxin-antitoxin system, parDE